MLDTTIVLWHQDARATCHCTTSPKAIGRSFVVASTPPPHCATYKMDEPVAISPFFFLHLEAKK
jgi:hypothetical protein